MKAQLCLGCPKSDLGKTNIGIWGEFLEFEDCRSLNGNDRASFNERAVRGLLHRGRLLDLQLSSGIRQNVVSHHKRNAWRIPLPTLTLPLHVPAEFQPQRGQELVGEVP